MTNTPTNTPTTPPTNTPTTTSTTAGAAGPTTAAHTVTSSGAEGADGGDGLPHLSGPVFVSDGGLETTLVFHEGLDLPDFAAFPLVDNAEGRAVLSRYYDPYFAIARRDRAGMVVDTPTWRANADWGPRLGYDHDELAAVNERSVAFVREVADRWPDVPTVINGVIGPRGDGYVIEDRMTVAEATSYHTLQAMAFAAAGADMVTAVTMTSADEAIGVVNAVRDVGLEVAIGFTVETDGLLPSGEALGEAIGRVDDATDTATAYFMINCAHPTHFADVLEADAPWLARIKAIRANASDASHAELDEAEELDRGDPADLAAHYGELLDRLPDLRVVGGCCGTDHEHVGRISKCIRERSDR